MLPVRGELSQIPGESSTGEKKKTIEINLIKKIKIKNTITEGRLQRPNPRKVCPRPETAINHTLSQCQPHPAGPSTFFFSFFKSAPPHQSTYCRSGGLAAGKVAEGAAEAGGRGGLGKRSERSSKRLLYKSDVLAKTRLRSKSFVSH